MRTASFRRTSMVSTGAFPIRRGEGLPLSFPSRTLLDASCDLELSGDLRGQGRLGFTRCTLAFGGCTFGGAWHCALCHELRELCELWVAPLRTVYPQPAGRNLGVAQRT